MPKYTRGRGTLVVAYREKVGTKGEATKREMAIKRLPRTAKVGMIEAFGGPTPCLVTN